MPGGRSTVKPTSANNPPSASDEGSHLELHLQQQLQEDIASDVYTECDVEHQENEIIAYLNKNLKKAKPNCNSCKTREEIEDQDIFLTPKCISPYADKALKSLTSSPSTELTKEYYALVPIDSNGGNILDKELKEQDLLFNAFHSIIKSQPPDIYKFKSSQTVKPTTLYLNINKNKKLRNSSSCDNLNDFSLSSVPKEENKNKSSLVIKKHPGDKISSNTEYLIYKTLKNIENVSDKAHESTYSPDSLIADDPSSSSDYLSAAYACSPGVTSSTCTLQLNVGENITRMENTFTSSDSGLENTGLLESTTSHKDITLADSSLIESTLHDLTTDDASNSQDSMSTSSPLEKNKMPASGAPTQNAIDLGESNSQCQNSNSSNRYKDSKSSKEEKQRQNEEIVILESSSLSSETGSWESVFPPKPTEKDLNEKFISHECELIDRNSTIEANNHSEFSESACPSLVQKSPFKSTSCFIDATLLMDDEDNSMNIKLNENPQKVNETPIVDTVTAPSQPVPFSSNKLDLSPNDWSESNDNEDSLEQTDAKDMNNRDLSPTIFEMTPVTEDSLISDAFEKDVLAHSKPTEIKDISQCLAEQDGFPLPTTTPHNSLRVILQSQSHDAVKNGSGTDEPITSKNVYVKNVKKSHESSPIVSGGASIKDHLPQVSTYSPLTRRKLENVPIVSGAYTPNLERCQSQSPKPSSSAAWVIDVSNNKNTDLKKQKDESSKHLNDSTNNINVENCNRSRSSVDSDGSEKSSHKFYIDFSNLPSAKPTIKQKTENPAEKKYIFSMFIDLDDKAEGGKSGVKEMPTRLSSSSNTKRSNAVETKNVLKSGNSSKDSNDIAESKINSLDPQINNNDAHDFEKYECLCDDPNISIKEIISLPKKVLVNLPKKSSNAADNSDASDTCSSQTTQDKTIVKSGNQEINNINTEGACALTNISKDGPGPSTRVDDDEENDWAEPGTSGLCYDVPGRYSTASTIREESTTDVESTDMDFGDSDFVYQDKDESTPEPFVKLSDLDKPLSKPYSQKAKKERAADMRMTRSIPENNWCGQNYNGAPISLDVISSFHSENALSLNRLFPHLQNEISRSMPGSLSSRNRSPMRPGAISSAGEGEDLASDTSELSSMPSSVGRSVVGNSTPEETGQTSNIINQCQSRLGQDLLRMFLEEIAPDVIVEVSGRRIKAHKCILSSRCQYFAGILSGGWVESAGNVIPLPPFAYNVVHFAMCHIYSGTSAIPESVSIVELATLADMLGLEGLKEAIMFSLKSKYCHNFHKPCPVCTAGVLECFPLSSLCGLDDLYHKCLRWITKHFPKVWPTRAFATLPADLMERCFQEHVVNLTVRNVADTVFGCGLAMFTLQVNVRGVDNVEVLCRRLINACAAFASGRLEAVLRSMETLPLDAPPPIIRALDEFIEAAIHRAPLDDVCRAYGYLEGVVREIQIQQFSKPDLINGYQNNNEEEETLVHARANVWKLKCQCLLVDDALRVVNTQAYRELPTILQQKLRRLGCVISPMQPRRSANMRNIRPLNPLNANQADIEQMRASFVPYAQRPSTSFFNAQDALRSHGDLRDPQKSNKGPKVKTTKAQEERAKFNMAKNTQTQTRTNTKTSTRLFENAKPRYLEPKASKSEKKAAQGKLMPKMMSSSESSRNSSPIQVRGMRGARGKSRQMFDRKGQAMSQDSLATSSRPRTAEPSTDSLSESQASNKYATFTKAKHTKSSVEPVPHSSSSVQSSRSQQSVLSKTRTKIPVSLTMSKTKPVNNKSNSDSSKKSNGSSSGTATTQASRNKTERKVPGSLMNATKSSSAKMVQRAPTKEKPTKSHANTKSASKPSGSRPNNEAQSDVPAMGRSGTFLKDEPTFGHNLDIDN